MRPFRRADALLGDPGRLRAVAEEEGYLFFPQLLPTEPIVALREQFAALLSRHGWLDPHADPQELRTHRPPIVEGMEEYWPVLLDFQKLEAFHALAHEPVLLEVFQTLFQRPVLVHPRNIGRIMFPGTPPTPPHQDYVHVQGTPNTWTAWIPLIDVPEELGGLEVLPRTHREGVYPVRRMPGAGGVGVAAELGEDWHGRPFAVGDVLIFHSWTVHRSRPNRTPDRIRLSVDYRYQPVDEPITADSLRPHFNRFDWETVYAGWRSQKLQYYWKDLPLQVVPFDRNILRFVDSESSTPSEGYR